MNYEILHYITFLSLRHNAVMLFDRVASFYQPPHQKHGETTCRRFVYQRQQVQQSELLDADQIPSYVDQRTPLPLFL